MGLYIRHTTVDSTAGSRKKGSGRVLEVIELLIGEERWYFYEKDVTLVSDDEIETELHKQERPIK